MKLILSLVFFLTLLISQATRIKFSYFNEGREKLEKAVNFTTKNIKNRFIQFSIQKKFWSYRDIEMEEDKRFILENLNMTDLMEVYQQEEKNF